MTADEELVHRNPEAVQSPTMRELATVLFRQRKSFLTIAGLVLILAVVFALAGEKYRSQLRILVRRGRADPPVAAQQNAPPDFSRAEVTEEELNSEVELLKDDDVMQSVVRATGLASRDWLRWLRPHEEEAVKIERAARKLEHRLNIESIKKTNLIAISYDESDPQLAAHVLQSLAAAYLEKHTEVHRPTGQFHFFDQQTGESRRQLEEAQVRLVDFTRSHDVVMAAQERDLVLQRVAELDATYRQAQVDMAETQRRASELKVQLQQLPKRTVTQSRESDNPELLRAMKSSLLDLELKRTQLLTKFEPQHRLVQEVDIQIAQAKAAIASEKTDPVRDETTDRDPNRDWAQAELQKAQVQMTGLAGRAVTANAHLALYRTLARRLGEDAITQDDLTSSEKAAEDNYLLYVRKREEARMGDALDEGGIVNVAIAQAPVAPALPVWPPAVVIAVGFIGAVVTGTGAAFAADYFDPALRTPDEVAACLEVPVLASIPEGMDRRLIA